MGCVKSKLIIHRDPSSIDGVAAPDDTSPGDSVERERAPTLLDQHQDFIEKQAQKDVKGILGPQRRRTLSKDVQQDIQLRGGVLPAPTEERQQINDKSDRFFVGTEAQLRAAKERKELDSALASKRRKSQLQKMQKNATPAGKKAIDYALEKEKGSTSFYGMGKSTEEPERAPLEQAIALTIRPIGDISAEKETVL